MAKTKIVAGYSWDARKFYHQARPKGMDWLAKCGETWLDFRGTKSQVRKKRPKLTPCPSCFKDGGS
jgi:hypothetical protein